MVGCSTQQNIDLVQRVQNHAARLIDQCHRYGRPQAACREPAGSYDKTTRTAICFEHKTQYLLIRAPSYTRIVVFWHISNIPPPPTPHHHDFAEPLLWNIAIQPAVGCYNSWANLLRSSVCYPLGEKLLWNRSITGNFDYIYCREIDPVNSLNLNSIRDRRIIFLQYWCLNLFMV